MLKTGELSTLASYIQNGIWIMNVVTFKSKQMTTIRRDNQSWISNTRMIKYQCKLENCVSGPHFEIPVHQWLPSTFAIYLDQQKFSFNLECESIHEWMLGKLITNTTFFRVMSLDVQHTSDILMFFLTSCLHKKKNLSIGQYLEVKRLRVGEWL